LAAQQYQATELTKTASCRPKWLRVEMTPHANRGKVGRQWIGKIKSRSLEMGTVVLISAEGSTETDATIPRETDHFCIHISGEKFPAAIVNVSAELLALNMMKGPTLFLEPVPVGHPAHGERSAPGVPTSVWKVTSVS
jgi:hypothetical protein